MTEMTTEQRSSKSAAATAAVTAGPNSGSPTGGGSYGKIAGLYDLEETLGSGHFAVVKLARHVFTGAKVAVKVVEKTKLDEVSKAHLFQEVRCMKLVQHPNVVRLYEVIDTQTKLYLVLEFGDGGDLYDYIMRHEGGLKEELAKKYFRQILRAITYCHKLHVVHRDLKPENCVFFEKLGVVKLTDFGFSNKFKPGQKLETFCGSLAYSAPEILLGDSYDAPAVDIWSLGVILFMLVCGQPPFEKANDSETLTMIMDCKYTVPSRVSKECQELIANMLVRDPKKRASIEEIGAHRWVMDGVDADTSDYYPLVSREHLSEDDHAFIIQKMINGEIATKEDILQALDKNKYNHITATYYLLAEIRLRKRREEEAAKAQMDGSIKKGGAYANAHRPTAEDDNKLKSDANKFVASPIAINVTAAGPSAAANLDVLIKPDKRSRKCSIVREEDEEESPYETNDGGNELCVAQTRRESISDGRLNKSIQERTGVVCATGNVIGSGATTTTGGSGCLGIHMGMPPMPKSSGRNKIMVTVDATLAQKLNQIDCSSPTTTVTGKSTTTAGGGRVVVGGGGGASNFIVTNNKIMPNKNIGNQSKGLLVTATATATASAISTENVLATPTAVDERSEDDNMQETLKGLKELEIGKLKPLPASGKGNVLSHRRSKLKIRTPSCSSSEASDDDSKARSNKKKMNKFVGDNPTRFRMHRRDSYDDSSDSQDQAFPPARSTNGGGGGSGHIMHSSSNNNSDKQDGQAQGRDQNNSEDTRKSANMHDNGKAQSDHTNIEKTSEGTAPDSGSGSSLGSTRAADISVEEAGAYNRIGSKLNTENCNGRRRRVRESQSLDRITEAQEYELRHRLHADEDYEDCVIYNNYYCDAKSIAYFSRQRNSLSNLSAFSLIETTEEYDDVADYYEAKSASANASVNGSRSGSGSSANGGSVGQTKINTAAQTLNSAHSELLREQVKNALNLNLNCTDRNYLKRNTKNYKNIFNITSISENDLVATNERKASASLAKNDDRMSATTMTTSGNASGHNTTLTTKCFVTIKKIRKLGKYFPAVVNFSS